MSSQVLRPRLSNALLVVALLGIAISGWLVFHHTKVTLGYQTGSSFCSWNSTFDCDSVARSRFAVWGGLPTASWALWFFIGLLGVAALPRKGAPFADGPYADLLLFLALVAAVPSVILLYISLFILKKICVLCCALYLLNLLWFVAVIFSNARSRPFHRALLNGFNSSLLLLSPLFKAEAPYRAFSQLAIFTLIVNLAAIAFLPDFLVVQYLAPAERSSSVESIVSASIQEWQRETPVKLNTQLTGSAAEKDFSHGDGDILLVVYSDFECPFCKQSAPLFAELADKYQARLVLKNFPLDSKCNSIMDRPLHEFACDAAVFARCSGEGGDETFWQVHDALVASEELTAATFEELITALNLDREAMAACRERESSMNRVVQDIEEGLELNLQGTPAVFINGRKVNEPLPEVVEGILKQIRTSSSIK